MNTLAKRSNLLKWAKTHNIYIIFVAIFAIAFFSSKEFRTVDNLMNLMNQMSIIGILAIGQTTVLLTGNFDLSHGSYVALCSVLLAILMPYGIPSAIGVTIIVLIALGAFNAFFVNRGVVSLIVTLGMTGIARSLALFLAKSDSIAIHNDSFKQISYGNLFGVLPYGVILWLVLVVILSFVLQNMRVGKHIHAVGGDKESARLSGIKINKIIYIVFIISALSAVAAGTLYASRLGVGLPDKSVGYEMNSIAASVIGGTSLFGGVGTQSGTLVGVLIFGIITNFFNLIGVSAYWQQVFRGLIIGIAVYINLRGNIGRKAESDYA